MASAPSGSSASGRLPGVTQEQEQRVRSQADGRPCHGVPGWRGEGLALHGRGSGHFPGGRGEPRLETAAVKSMSQQGVGAGAALGHQPHSPGLSPQSSQPSTTSPFKQEVFVYSPSPSSESPSLGTATTPIIMSRSPTGPWHLTVASHGQGGDCAQPLFVGHEPQAH